MAVDGQSNQIVLDDGGNVGIGTATAGAKLDIAGNVAQTFSGTTTNGFSATSSTLTSGALMSLGVSGTAAFGSTQRALDVSLTGANANAAQITYGMIVNNSHTGSSPYNIGGDFTAFGGTTNVGLNVNASGGTNNYGLLVQTGNVGIGDTSPTALLTVGDGDLFQVDTSGNVTFQNNAAHSIGVASVGAGAGKQLTITAGPTSAASQLGGRLWLAGGDSTNGGNGGNVLVTTGASTPATGTSGIVLVGTADQTGGTSGYISIGTGSATTVGNITIDPGVAATTKGQVYIGTSNAGNINVGNGSGAILITTQAAARTERLCSNASNANGGALTGASIGDCSATSVDDYAEQYPVASGITYGDIVAMSETMVTTTAETQVPQLIKSVSPYQPQLLGVVSNNYGDPSSVGYNIKDEDNPMPVALNGRVPVNVSIENGPIAIGDPITSSATPGGGMKATQNGMIIGFALNAYDKPEPGKIMVFMNLGWWNGATVASTTDSSGIVPSTAIS
ncbi:MAG: hypothetical protein AAB692_03750, partial [Patescibacteria group bacterium]